MRTRIKVRNKSRYVKRNKKGQFTDVQNINKTIRADARRTSKKPYKKGYGYETDSQPDELRVLNKIKKKVK